MSDEALARLVERSEDKHWGKYRGIVVDRKDPDKLGRLRVKVPSLLGDAVTGWAWPVSPYAGAGYGLLLIPQVDDVVWVEFAEGELDHPLWTGMAWAKPGGEAEIPEEARDHYPDAQVLRTKAGNVIVLDDKSGSERIVIRAKNGAEITIDARADHITVKAKNVTIEADGVAIQQAGGNPQELVTKAFVDSVFKSHVHAQVGSPPAEPIPPPVVPIFTSVLKAQ